MLQNCGNPSLNSPRTTHSGLSSMSAFGWKTNMPSRGSSMSGWDEYLADPQAQNAYGYARGNPLRYIDPDGKLSVDISLNFIGNLLGPFGVGGTLGARIELWPGIGIQTYTGPSFGAGGGGTVQARLNPTGRLDPAGEYVSLEGVVAKGLIGGTIARQVKFNPQNPFNFSSKDAQTSVGVAAGLQTSISYSHLYVGQPKYFFNTGSAAGTNNSGGIGNSKGNFIGTYDFGPGVGKYNYGTQSWEK